MPNAGTILAQPLHLPCGATLANRIAKGAMTEGLADTRNRATQAHAALYALWAEGGPGLMLTGNIQVDRRYMERPGNIAIDGVQSPEALKALADLAAAGRQGSGHFWAQLSHAGRQTPASLAQQSVGPSAIASGLSDYFAVPRALDESEIEDIIARFVHAAHIAQDAGFTGVQVHAAHGYLFNQFLSPDVNDRTDNWGGSLENRARIVLETVRRVRDAVGRTFPVSVKLNVSDFHKGGFTPEDSTQVAHWLKQLGLDLLELSGGTAEEPSMFLANRDHVNPDAALPIAQSQVAGEVYFLDYGQKIRSETGLPVMVTGGFRTVTAMQASVSDGATDMVGMGRPFCIDPQLPQKILSGQTEHVSSHELDLRLADGVMPSDTPQETIDFINRLGPGLWFQHQVMRLGRGEGADPALGLLDGMMALQENDARAAQALER